MAITRAECYLDDRNNPFMSLEAAVVSNIRNMDVSQDILSGRAASWIVENRVELMRHLKELGA